MTDSEAPQRTQERLDQLLFGGLAGLSVASVLEMIDKQPAFNNFLGGSLLCFSVGLPFLVSCFLLEVIGVQREKGNSEKALRFGSCAAGVGRVHASVLPSPTPRGLDLPGFGFLLRYRGHSFPPLIAAGRRGRLSGSCSPRGPARPAAAQQRVVPIVKLKPAPPKCRCYSTDRKREESGAMG